MVVTPGQQDQNVAIAWTQWLLREEDAPQSVMDAIMNGIAGGAVVGSGADVMASNLRRSPGALAWTRRGAVAGCLVSTASHLASYRRDDADHVEHRPVQTEHCRTCSRADVFFRHAG